MAQYDGMEDVETVKAESNRMANVGPPLTLPRGRVRSRLQEAMAAGIILGQSDELRRPCTALTVARPFSLGTAAIMARQRTRAQERAREREEERVRLSTFKAKPAPLHIYGDLATTRENARKRAQDLEKKRAEEWARSRVKARPMPVHIYGDAKTQHERRLKRKTEREVANVAGCTAPPPAADLPSWHLKDGTVLSAQDERSAPQADEWAAMRPVTAAASLPSGRHSNEQIASRGGCSNGGSNRPESLSQRLREAAASGAGLHGGGLYGMAEYWEERYASRPLERGGKALFEEWYGSYSCLRNVLLPLLHPTGRILHVGCGQSRLGLDLYADGFCNILNMDISSACVAQLVARYSANCPKMHFRVMVRATGSTRLLVCASVPTVGTHCLPCAHSCPLAGHDAA